MSKERLTIDEAILHVKKTAEEKYLEGFLCHANPDDGELDKFIECGRVHEQLAKYLEELKQYRDLEEQGLILQLPVKMRQILYTNIRMQGWYFRMKDAPYRVEVSLIGLDNANDMGDGFFNVVYENHNHMMQFNFSDIGKNIFLTRSEAEEKLRGLEGK